MPPTAHSTSPMARFSRSGTLWPQIAEALGIAPGEDRVQNFKDHMPARAGEWDAIRERHGLRAPAMDAFIRQRKCAPRFVQHICCPLPSRLPIKRLTVPSTALGSIK
jgi:hypothetical protein